MGSDNDTTQYSMLVDISRAVGELQSDVKSTKGEIKELDKTVSNKISELYDAMTKRQDFMRDSIESEFAVYRTKIKELEEKVDDLEVRAKKLEESPKNRLFEYFEKFKGLLLAAIMAALVGWCMSFMRDLTKAVRTPPIPIEKHIESEGKE